MTFHSLSTRVDICKILTTISNKLVIFCFLYDKITILFLNFPIISKIFFLVGLLKIASIAFVTCCKSCEI